MKKVVVFGATGNVGSYMVKYLQEQFCGTEYEVIASGQRKTDVFSAMSVSYVSVDITRPADFDALPSSDVYAVILLAATIPSYMDVYQANKYLQTNVMGTYNVLEYCRRVRADRILFSTTVFDISGYATENTALIDDLPAKFSYTGDHAVYVISKNTALELLEHYKQEYGIKKFVFRFPTIYAYSPNHYYFPNGIKTMRPLYKMIDAAMRGAPLEIWGNPDYKTDMTHVYDCSQMFYKALLVKGEGGIYNVGTGMPVTLQEKIEAIRDVFSPQDNPSPIVYCPKKLNTGGFVMDVNKAKRELGYQPIYTIKKLLEDYKREMEINRFKELRLP